MESRKAIALVLALTALCAAAIVGLGGCGKGGPGGGAESGLGPVWAQASRTTCDESRNVSDSVVFEYDSQGNLVKSVCRFENAGIYAITYEYSDFTPEGYPQTLVQTAEGGTAVQTSTSKTTYTMENGRATTARTVTEEGFTTMESTYTYHANGKIRSQTDRIDLGSQAVLNTTTYDENGLPLQQSVENSFSGSSGSTATKASYEWTFDTAGNPAGYTLTTSNSDGLASTTEYQVKCDDHGNIVRVLDAQGNTVSEIEYVQIDNPSTYVWLQANIRS